VMAEEEKDQEQNEPETKAEAAAEAAAPEEPAAEAPAEEPAAEAPAAPAEAEPAEPAEQLSPKQRRRISRSRATGPGGPPRSLEERLRERAEERARKAKERTRWRAKQREKKGRDSEKSPDSVSRIGGQPQDEPAVTRESAARKTRQGVVVSSKADKTITVRIDRVARHRVYGKVMRETGTLHAHDERNEANEGDVVRVAESRPLSRTKRWRLLEVLEKAR
jgi:small subunit ribosomal protein S17